MSTAKASKTATPVAAAVTQIEEAVAAGKETIESVVKASSEAAAKGLEQVAVLSKEQVQAAVIANTKAFKGFEDLVQFNKDNLDAAVRTSTLLARAMQDLSQALFGLAQEAVDESVAAGQALAGAKTVQEVVELQSSLAKTSFDKLVSEGGKINELVTKLTAEATAPINARVAEAMAKLRNGVV